MEPVAVDTCEYTETCFVSQGSTSNVTELAEGQTSLQHFGNTHYM